MVQWYVSLKQRCRRFYFRHLEASIHTFKYLLAFLIGYVVIQFIPSGKSQWVLITIAVVMGSQAVIGLQVNKAIMRILGTLVGAVLGGITLFLPHDHLVAILSLILAVLFFSFLAKRDPSRNYIAILGMATFSMIAFAVSPTYETALLRVIDILIGIGISLGVSRFVFPLNSPLALLLSVSQNIQNMSQLITLIYFEDRNRRHDDELLTLDAKISQQFEKQRTIIGALKYESLAKHKLEKESMAILRYLRAIYYYLLFIDTSLWELKQQNTKETAILQKTVKPFMKAMLQLFAFFSLDETALSDKTIVKRLEDQYLSFSNATKDHAQSKHHQQSIEVIHFSMRRVEVCARRLVQAWAVMKTSH